MAGFALMAALVGCARTAPAAPVAPCDPLPGAEALLSAPAARLIVIGVEAAPEASALLLTACAALARGERVAALLPADPQWDETRAALAAWTAAGASLIVAALPPFAEDDRAASQATLAHALAGAADGAAADRAVALVDAESAARRPLGLSGDTWAPAGALLTADQAVTLLALGSVAPEPRLSLAPFEDMPTSGAARAYDGLITLPDPEPATPGERGLSDTGATEQALRGRSPLP